MLQTNVLEFLVSGRLDGITPNPPFQRADAVVPRPDPPGADPENIYQFEVEDLGIIDLTFPPLVERLDGPVALGNRYLPWLYIDTGGVVGGAGAGVNVAAFRPGAPSPILQQPVVSLDGSAGVYLRRCIFVPHGSSLQLAGDIMAMAGTPILVRFGVLLPQTRTEEELIAQACCCTEQFDPIEPVGCITPPNPTSTNPPSVAAGSPNEPVEVLGDGFESGDVVSFQQPVGPPLPVVSTVFVDQNQIDVELDLSGLGVGGTYNVVVTRPGEPNCVGILPGFQVFEE